jgi:ribosome modulation factor
MDRALGALFDRVLDRAWGRGSRAGLDGRLHTPLQCVQL